MSELDATAVGVQRRDDTQLTACIEYDYAAVASPDTVAGAGTRLFTLTAESDGTWQVTRIGDADSCGSG